MICFLLIQNILKELTWGTFYELHKQISTSCVNALEFCLDDHDNCSALFIYFFVKAGYRRSR
jgi:hypothetical protein